MMPAIEALTGQPSPFDYAGLYRQLRAEGLDAWLEAGLQAQVATRLDPGRHGELGGWLDLLVRLPQIPGADFQVSDAAITISGTAVTDAARASIRELLQGLRPWRKGPFLVHGILVDSEWRSDWKWDRLAPHISSLRGRRVLDVGCGNGYYAWRMLGAGARMVIGIDPGLRHVVQFQAIRHFAGKQPVHVLPLALEDLPADLRAFDTVFSMGVFYHRRAPLDHLLALRGALRPGGELVLETLVIAGGPGTVLVPEGRYAKMRNVWFIPSPATLEAWLRRSGFHRVRCVDITTTRVAEQRATDWMPFESLADFLDPADPSLTIEAYPAPQRAIFLAEAT